MNPPVGLTYDGDGLAKRSPKNVCDGQHDETLAIRTVDVKAVHGPKPDPPKKKQASWSMPKIEARGGTADFFYVLVWMGEEHGDFATPEFFVLPASWAKDACATGHAAWAAEKATRDAASEMRRLGYSDVVQ